MISDCVIQFFVVLTCFISLNYYPILGMHGKLMIFPLKWSVVNWAGCEKLSLVASGISKQFPHLFYDKY
jgi:hypothetical protein